MIIFDLLYRSIFIIFTKLLIWTQGWENFLKITHSCYTLFVEKCTTHRYYFYLLQIVTVIFIREVISLDCNVFYLFMKFWTPFFTICCRRCILHVQNNDNKKKVWMVSRLQVTRHFPTLNLFNTLYPFNDEIHVVIDFSRTSAIYNILLSFYWWFSHVTWASLSLHEETGFLISIFIFK